MSVKTEYVYWSYEGSKRDIHEASVCLVEKGDRFTDVHECVATAHGKTEEQAVQRAILIADALNEWQPAERATEGRNPSQPDGRGKQS